jgi:hypothetical protein
MVSLKNHQGIVLQKFIITSAAKPLLSVDVTAGAMNA